MVQGVTASKLSDVARQEHALALEEYCASLARIAEALEASVPPSPEELERAQTARLRLDNARTLLRLSIDVAVGGLAAARHRHLCRVH
jgi:hypothetical protein